MPKPRERRPECNGAAGETSGIESPAKPKTGETSQRPERPKEGARPTLPPDGGAAVMRPAVMQLPPDVPVMQPAPEVPEVVARPGDVIALTPNVLSVKHWDRLLGGVLYAATPRVDWSALLRRSFQVDVMQCAKCGGRLRVLAVITEREPVRRILSHLGLPPEAPPLAHARDPTDDLEDVEPSGQLGLGLA